MKHGYIIETRIRERELLAFHRDTSRELNGALNGCIIYKRRHEEDLRAYTSMFLRAPVSVIVIAERKHRPHRTSAITCAPNRNSAELRGKEKIKHAERYVVKRTCGHVEGVASFSWSSSRGTCAKANY